MGPQDRQRRIRGLHGAPASKGLDTAKLIERSVACRDAGIDAITIPDGPRVSARMSALAAACIIERRAGIETILHHACRDRKLLGITYVG